MSQRVVRTNRQLSAARQIHAAIEHFREGGFECVITLCSAAEGQMPEPKQSTHLFRILQEAAAELPAVEGQKDDFNYAANWLKHFMGNDSVEIDEWLATAWLNRAISKYRAVYGSGTSEMATLFAWAKTSENSGAER